MEIAIVTPSRGRPEHLNKFFHSVNDTCSGDNTISFLFGMDRDDPTRFEYYDLLSHFYKTAKDNVFVTMIQDVRKPISKIWNELVSLKTWSNSADAFIMGNDDFVFETIGWDNILKSYLLKADHPFYCYWFDDGINGKDHCAIPILTKYWIGALGYFVPTHFKFFFHDTWIFDIAKMAGTERYIPEVKLRHRHFTSPTGIAYDETSAHWRTNNINAYDKGVFNARVDERINMSNVIKERIKIYLQTTK